MKTGSLISFLSALTLALLAISDSQAAWSSCSYDQQVRILGTGARCGAGTAMLCGSGQYACCKSQPRGDVNGNGLEDDGTEIVCGAAEAIPRVMSPESSPPVKAPRASSSVRATGTLSPANSPSRSSPTAEPTAANTVKK